MFGRANDNRSMVMSQIRGRGVKESVIIEAFLATDRADFVPQEYRDSAYMDHPLGIGEGQTISQPYIVAYMTQQLMLEGNEKVLEIGTGSGYQTAILSRLAKEVYTIERIRDLGEDARETLESLGYKNIHFKIGDGYRGWPEESPFDAIIITAAPSQIPLELVSQLSLGGRMIVPVGERYQIQVLYRIRRTERGFTTEDLEAVAFVPMLPGTE